MVVREEDLLDVRQPDGRALELPLRPLSAVEEEPLAAATDEHGRRAALRGRRRRGGAEEDDVEIHPPILGGAKPNPDFGRYTALWTCAGWRMRRTDDLARSITLLRAFLLASALILVAGGAVLGSVALANALGAGRRLGALVPRALRRRSCPPHARARRPRRREPPRRPGDARLLTVAAPGRRSL